MINLERAVIQEDTSGTTERWKWTKGKGKGKDIPVTGHGGP
jgi:hypothetical protein